MPAASGFDLGNLHLNPVASFGIVLTEAPADPLRGFAPCVRTFEAAYGWSETYTADTFMSADAVRWGAHGLPIPGHQIRIVDAETGAPCGTGETGEIVMCSRGNFWGYWSQADAIARTLRDGWVHTGDMGRLDADGFLTFSGRFKEMMKVSGYSVFPKEVEVLLINHLAVAQTAVLGVPEAEKGEVVKAFIVRKPGPALTKAELIVWARDNMAAYKVPPSVKFIDALPATGAGKVLRRLLRQRERPAFKGGPGRNWLWRACRQVPSESAFGHRRSTEPRRHKCRATASTR